MYSIDARTTCILSIALLQLLLARSSWSEPVHVSGVYPHLAMFNEHGECGTGAVVPWAGKLWAITYAPHFPNGSTDKLYAIDRNLSRSLFADSVGGTPANRMIHSESKQLFIGPYAVDAEGKVRVIPPRKMPGRLTGTARHLQDPAEKVYFGTMEEGIYEVDVRSLRVKELFADNQGEVRGRKVSQDAPLANLPGYHGKGLYSGQGVLVYANNGEYSYAAQRNPSATSGVLAEWDGVSGDWTVVRRNQFTEVTGPSGIHGATNPDVDPIWSIGWDAKSLLLAVRTANVGWSFYRLPKGSHCYDGAHGWNTEWPRIRDIGEDDLLMTMHGLFWRFPRSFKPGNSLGIEPRSAYLKVIGDFCRWDNRLVFGCDDTARNEFLNKRKAKGNLKGPGQSQSNLWFTAHTTPDELGPALGRGAVWMNESVQPNQPSDPFLFRGFDSRCLHLAHEAEAEVTFLLEVDRKGKGKWAPLKTVTVGPRSYQYVSFDKSEQGAWVRLSANKACPRATAFLHYAAADRRTASNASVLNGVADATTQSRSTGSLWALDQYRRRLGFAADDGYYELDEQLKLIRVDNESACKQVVDAAPFAASVLRVDAASVIYTDDDGRRWRLPKGDATFDNMEVLHSGRIDREVVTERDLFNCHGTFYELPARNAGGFAKVRPIATHNKQISDYCSYRGLMVISGIADSAASSKHIVRSDDHQAALWVGVIDDLWRLGKPRGKGGPWHDTPVSAGAPSDPYLMTGYDQKSFTASHDSQHPVNISIEVDISGDGDWMPWKSLLVTSGEQSKETFPKGFHAYWVRAVSDRDCSATVQFDYR